MAIKVSNPAFAGLKIQKKGVGFMKKKKLNSLVSIILILFMLVFTSACQGPTSTSDTSKQTESTEEASSGKEAGTEKEDTTSSSLISKEKITLSILTTEWANIQVGSDMPVYKELEKRTNIHLDFQLLPLTDPAEKFNLIMASEDLPDIVAYADGAALNKYGMEGAFIPLQDLIKKYAPDIKKAYDNPLPDEPLPYRQNAWAEVTAGDGNIYTIALISAANAIGAVYAIRVDWLEKLGLKIPETADDLYQVLKAFKEQDPNGNGKADEIPFAAGQGGKTGRILPVVNAFDAHIGFYVDPSDDTIKYGPVEENFKEGLAFLNKLYKEGLLEEDYLTATNDQWLARATGNQVGFAFLWPASGIGVANNGLKKLDPNFRFEPMPPLKSKSGKQYKDTATAGRLVQPRMAITVANKYPVETMKLFNYCFTEEGARLIEYGIEGIHHKIVDGKPVYTDLILNNPEGLDPEIARIKDGLIATALPYHMGWECHFQAMAKAAPWTVKAWELYREPGMVEAPLPTLKFTDQELARVNQLTAEINTYEDPMIDKFIMGVEPLDKFDEFVDNIKKAGLDELLKLYNDAYKRYKENAAKFSQ